MASKTLVLGFFLCLLSTTALATTRSTRLGGPEFCNLQQLYATQPNQLLQFEGGSIERWEINDEQFQCVNVEPARVTIQPNSLFVPSFHPTPMLVFIEQGEGIIGVHFPGCAETFDTGVQQQQSPFMGKQGQQQQKQQQQQQQGQQQGVDSHQNVHRFKRGDIVAIPAGAVHWAYNDGNQQVVAIILNDINNPSNQLDLSPRTFFLAGGITSQHIQGQQIQGQQGQGQQGRQQQMQGQKQQQQGRFNMDNILAGFDTELLAEAFNTEPEIIQKMQSTKENGVIVTVREPMRFVTPEFGQQGQFQQQGQFGQQGRQQGGPSNGIEEKICSTKVLYNLDNQREADVFSRQAGKLNTVTEHKLPILSYMDLSAEKGILQQNAMVSPHWSINSHTVVYVLNGDARIQVVSNNGQTVLDQQVNKGEMFVVPQFFPWTAQAGQNNFEWVAFKTNKSPMKSPLAGYTSVFRAMPLGVIQNSYSVSPSQAQSLKTNRQTESLLFSPQRTSRIS